MVPVRTWGGSGAIVMICCPVPVKDGVGIDCGGNTGPTPVTTGDGIAITVIVPVPVGPGPIVPCGGTTGFVPVTIRGGFGTTVIVPGVPMVVGWGPVPVAGICVAVGTREGVEPPAELEAPPQVAP